MNNVIKVDFGKKSAYKNREKTVEKTVKRANEFESNHPWALRIFAVILIFILTLFVF